MWHEGKIEIPTAEGTKIAKYQVKAYDEGSEYGINGGRISKLWIKMDGKVITNYDRGWDIKPNENNQAEQIAYCIVLENYN